MDIAKKTLLITGANRGIGRAMLEEALRRGASRVYAGVRSDFRHSDVRVTALGLDVTNAKQIAQAAVEVRELDVLVNNAGVAMFDDLSDPDVIQRHMEVNVLGVARITRAFLPLLKRSHGAIVNNLSLAGIAPVPVTPGYSISKAAAVSLTQSYRTLLLHEGVSVHAAFIGPTDTDMSRGIEVPKATPGTTAQGIYDGLAEGQEDIFPDPMSRPLANGWREGIAKTLEREFRVYAPAASAA